VLSKQRYVNVSIPKELAERVDGIVLSGLLSYRSRAEFVVEAIRLRLTAVEKEVVKNNARQIKVVV
jgi:metal-responsive CopG/Arc/MetJ family transcriptional regulator